MSLSLAKNVIVAGADNHPFMLDKTQYSSWASRMLLYIKGKENGKLLIDSVFLNDLLIRNSNRTQNYENGVETEVPPKTAQALLQRQRERKAKSILLLAIPDEYQLSLLEVHGAAVSNEDANQKFLRALPSSRIIRGHMQGKVEHQNQGTGIECSLECELKDKSNDITRLKNQLDETLREKDDLKAKIEQFETSSKNLNKLINSQICSKDKTGLGYRDQLNENDSSDSELFNSVFDSRSSDGDDIQTNDRFKKDNGYHAVPPPLTGNYMSPLADLSFAGLDDSIYRPTTNKTSASVSQVEASTSQTSVSQVEARMNLFKPKQLEKPRIITQNPKVDRRGWNGQMTQKLGLGFGFTKKACFVCGSYSHLIKDCDFHEKRMAKKSVLKNMGKNSGQKEIRPVLEQAQRINHQNKFVSSVVLTRFGRVPVSATKQSSLRATTSTSTFRPVNTATHTNRVNVSKLKTNAFHKSHSPIRRHTKRNKDFLTDSQRHLLEVFVGLVEVQNVVLSGDLTCLYAKATIDESNLWHRRLGHVKFKTMKKLVKGNLVRGLPSKIFDNDHTCVACQKGKQHKASLTDDFSRFSWVFFLSSKDETNGILKRFITEIENQLNHKVKVIRCDIWKELKNREMNEFCGLKRIKREFSIARTPQQNEVAGRKHMTPDLKGPQKAARTITSILHFYLL
ncbi:putative ribonuclease H-like domain-containing protein [Tanacetum coccineum]